MTDLSVMDFLGPDTISSHNWCKNGEWPSVDDSTWTLAPPAGVVYKLESVDAIFSEDLVMSPEQEMYIQFWLTGYPLPVVTYIYKNMIDWINRAQRTERIEYQGPAGTELTGNVVKLHMPFAFKVLLWSSVDLVTPKLNYMTIKIGNNEPYKKVDGVTDAEVAKARYFVERYTDPDYVAP